MPSCIRCEAPVATRGICTECSLEEYHGVPADHMEAEDET